jgi:uncharacterized membrane protein YkvA (DUF1232 family)
MKKLRGTIRIIKGLIGAKSFTGTTSTWEEDAKDFVKMIRAMWKGDYRVKKRNILFVFFGLLYILNPMDLLPAIALGPIGIIDDAAVLVFVFKRITSELQRFGNIAKFEDAEVLS